MQQCPEPNYPGRSERIVGLFTDRSFGLVAWAPIFLASVPALAALVRRRPAGWDLLVLPLGAGWLVATFVALTMQGFWWPGRQVVVVVPCLVLATTWWAGGQWAEGRFQRRTTGVPWAWVPWVSATVFGLVAWTWLVVVGWQERITLVFDFAGTGNPVVRAWRQALPELRSEALGTATLTVAWYLVFAALAWWGWRSAPKDPAAGRSALGDEDAGAGEGTDAHVTALDLDGGGAVG